MPRARTAASLSYKRKRGQVQLPFLFFSLLPMLLALLRSSVVAPSRSRRGLVAQAFSSNPYITTSHSRQSVTTATTTTSTIQRRRRTRRIPSLFMSSTQSSSSQPAQQMMPTATANHPTKAKAKLVTRRDLAACGQRLAQGDLVAFPTETVYGLGCHALDETACRKVFAAKERPLTDPLIVHVNEPAQAFGLWEATATSANNDNNNNNLEAQVLQVLFDAFWPGPLTLVAKASSAVPAVVTAGTGFVAARSPSHALARALLDATTTGSDNGELLPIAAPSANKFGHVSPTTAQHVWDDLKDEDVWILQDDQIDDDNDKATGGCHVGVESSVAKLEMDQNDTNSATLTVLRQGAVSVQDIQAALAKAGLTGPQVRVVAKSKERVTEITATVAPGQNIRHYSPHVPSFLLSVACIAKMKDDAINCNGDSVSAAATTITSKILSQAVVLDFGQQLAFWQNKKSKCNGVAAVLAYRDLSPSGDSARAAQWVYESLRWAEQVENAKYILFPALDDPQILLADGDNLSSLSGDALLLAVQDRLTRAASGVVLDSLETLAQS